jgi:ZIP family zinc transporter
MSTTQTLILGAIAGLTIFVGLPMGRVRSSSVALQASLTAVATGILLFLFWDVISHGVEPIDAHLVAHKWAGFAGYVTLFGLGVAAGMMSLVYYDSWLKDKRATPLVGPGAAAVDEFAGRRWIDELTPGKQLALLIAVGIGVHNFGEGLAIGQAAVVGTTSLAVTLIVGFALHNATEGFAICGPLTGEGTRPSWGFLAAMGVIGGLPTFAGTVIGQAWSSQAMSVVFFAIAAGSILYVVQELMAVNRSYGRTVLVTWLVFAGILLGFATDFVVSAAGV